MFFICGHTLIGPVHVELPPRNEAPSPVYSDSSLDSSSYFSRSSSSLSHYSHPYAAACATSFEHKPSITRSPPTRKSSLGLRSSLDRLTDHFNSHSNINKSGPPILRLAVSPPSSPTSEKSVIVSSPSLSSSPVSNRTSGKLNSSIHKRSTSIDGHNKNHYSTTFPSSPGLNTSDMKFTLRTARPSTAPSRSGWKDYEDEDIAGSSCDSPSSISASASSARRRKMERLRKLLGYEVPMHLVFPDQEEKKVCRNNSVTSSTIMKDWEVIPKPVSPMAVAATVVPRSKANGKITSVRDSMGEYSPHKANRPEQQKIRKSSSKQHAKSSSLPSTPSPPALVQAFAPLPSLDEDTSQKRLCVIVESPEEHGSSGLEGFGLGGCTIGTKPRTTTTTTKKPQPPRQDDLFTTGHGGRKSQGIKEEEDTRNKLWSTRRGYTGWDRSMTLGRISESPLLSLEDERRSMIEFRKSPVYVDF